MPRILERGAIESGGERAAPRVRLPDRENVFVARAARLRELATEGAIGHSLAGYLHLMAALAEAQHAALGRRRASLPDEGQRARARTHGMPVIHATGWPREAHWDQTLRALCDALLAGPDQPAGARAVLDRLGRSERAALERQADAILAGRAGEIDIAAAPFVMAALQVHWVDLASRLPLEAAIAVTVPGVCPACGSLPVASVVRSDQLSQGHRFLHCALCATEWHQVRVTCSHCQSTKGISYRSIEGSIEESIEESIEGGPQAIRAECCDSCRTYRKILYQEKDARVEPVADDLASLTLDLLVAEEGFHRASGNPMLWQSTQPAVGTGP